VPLKVEYKYFLQNRKGHKGGGGNQGGATNHLSHKNSAEGPDRFRKGRRKGHSARKVVQSLRLEGKKKKTKGVDVQKKREKKQEGRESGGNKYQSSPKGAGVQSGWGRPKGGKSIGSPP